MKGNAMTTVPAINCNNNISMKRYSTSTKPTPKQVVTATVSAILFGIGQAAIRAYSAADAVLNSRY